MSFLHDTNVISEATRPEPSPCVVAWLRENQSKLLLDPIVLGEIRLGILLAPHGRRREALEIWFSSHVQSVACLPWNATTALHWAELLKKLRQAGKTMPLKDSMIAATALSRNLTIATRNVRDFRHAGIAVVNPFQADS